MFDELEIRLSFPNLDSSGFEITSPATKEYNCIAWVADEDDRWWWPDKNQQAYWPQGIPREVTLEAFLQAFQSLGYECCDSARLELGFERIALFTGATGRPTHAAKQLSNGKWTSKLGDGFDITHELDGVSGFRGRSYGKVAQIMKRPITTQ